MLSLQMCLELFLHKVANALIHYFTDKSEMDTHTYPLL